MESVIKIARKSLDNLLGKTLETNGECQVLYSARIVF